MLFRGEVLKQIRLGRKLNMSIVYLSSISHMAETAISHIPLIRYQQGNGCCKLESALTLERFCWMFYVNERNDFREGERLFIKGIPRETLQTSMSNLSKLCCLVWLLRPRKSLSGQFTLKYLSSSIPMQTKGSILLDFFSRICFASVLREQIQFSDERESTL